MKQRICWQGWPGCCKSSVATWAWRARECIGCRCIDDRIGFFELVGANAQHSKAVRGAKNGCAGRRMECGRGMQHGLLKASFVPSQEQQDLRDLTRLLLSPGARTNSARQSGPTSVLEEAGLKLSSVRSSVMGWGGTCHPACAVCRRKRPAAPGGVDASKRPCNPGASSSRSGRRGTRAPPLPLARTAHAH
jgi:hypothetical protein